MLEITYGQSRRLEGAQQLVGALAGESGSLYLGYPVLATTEEPITVDALLVSEAHGLWAFVVHDDAPGYGDAEAWNDLVDEQDLVYVALEKSLIQHEALRSHRSLAVTIQVVTVFPTAPDVPGDHHAGQLPQSFAGIGDVTAMIGASPPLPPSACPPLPWWAPAVLAIRAAARAAINRSAPRRVGFRSPVALRMPISHLLL